MAACLRNVRSWVRSGKRLLCAEHFRVWPDADLWKSIRLAQW